jgi:uncharacterized protein (TIGR02217 family)
MTFFDSVQLPSDIERGAQGDFGFKTTVFPMDSGFEQRNINWSQSKGSWNVGYGIQSLAQLQSIRAIHQIMNGKGHGFRFKFWFDFEIGDPADAVATKQLIALGDGVDTTFQSIKTYVTGALSYSRNIKKIVTGTDRVWINSTELTRNNPTPGAGEYAIDVTTGIITTGDIPGGAASGGDGPSGEDVVYLVSEYDVPVRFDIDQLNTAIEIFNAGSIPNIPIVELRIA